MNAKDGGRSPFIAIRTKVFDDRILRAATENGMRQIVSLAAGLDCRVLRLDWPEGTTYYEVDQDDIVAYKAAQFAELDARLNGRWSPVVGDLADGWNVRLLETKFDRNQPSVWLCEGIFYYLSEPLVRSILMHIAELAAPGSILLCDIINKQMMTSAIDSIKELNRKMASIGCPMTWGVDDLPGFFEQSGWSVEEWLVPGEEAANFDRWPARIPFIPKEFPGWPRFFLVTAVRSATGTGE